MHIVHAPTLQNTDTVGGVIGILFDRYDYDKNVSLTTRNIINKFFDSMQFDLTNDTSPLHIPFGELMEALNKEERYVY